MVTVMKKLLYGVGVNDANYVVRPTVSGSRAICIFFQTWRDMIDRCYSKASHKAKPTYVECSVCDEWLTFSKFKKWMELQEWNGRQLDKDILIDGNKIYSPTTCAFVDKRTNVFVISRKASRGKWLIGACWHKNRKCFVANCSNPFTGKLEHLGIFDDDVQAHNAWRKRKHELACQLAGLQTDGRVADALRSRYA
jgi:hypothetical protein